MPAARSHPERTPFAFKRSNGLQTSALSGSQAIARRGRWSSVLACVILVGVSGLAYLNAGHDEFLFDSASQSAGSPRVTDSVAQAAGYLGKAPFLPGYRLTIITFALNHAFNVAVGLEPFNVRTYLIVNVLIHALNACLVFYLIRSLLRQISPGLGRPVWVSLAPAILFAVHPLQASSVAYIFQRRGTLATLFLLLGVHAYLRVRTLWSTATTVEEGRDTESRNGPGRGWRVVLFPVALAVCYWLSFMSKELGLVLPFVLVSIELCLRAPDWPALKRALVWTLPVVACTVVGVLIFLWSRSIFDPLRFQVQTWGFHELWGPWTQFLTESRAFAHYWKLLLLPLPRWCCIDHSFALSSHLTEHGAIFAILFHAGLLILAGVAAWKRCTLAAIGVFWFYIGLLPYAFVPQVELLVEYETYLPSIGVALIVAGVLKRVQGCLPLTAQAVSVGVVASCLLMITIQRNVIYQSAFNLWSDAVEKSPDKARPHANLAAALVRLDRTGEAIREYREALRLAPDAAEVHRGLAIALSSKGGASQEALNHYKEAVRLRPDLAERHYDLANAMLARRERDEAIREYEEAARLAPAFAENRYNLANALYQKGQLDEAIEQYQQALQARPEFVECHYNLGDTYVRRGRLEDAIREFREALKLRPNDATIHYVLALVLSKQGQRDAAILEYRKVLELDPNHREAKAHLSAALGTAGS